MSLRDGCVLLRPILLRSGPTQAKFYFGQVRLRPTSNYIMANSTQVKFYFGQFYFGQVRLRPMFSFMLCCVCVGWGPEGGEPQISRLFSLSRSFSLSGVFSGALPERKKTREDPKRERKKSENGSSRAEKRANIWAVGRRGVQGRRVRRTHTRTKHTTHAHTTQHTHTTHTHTQRTRSRHNRKLKEKCGWCGWYVLWCDLCDVSAMVRKICGAELR